MYSAAWLGEGTTDYGGLLSTGGGRHRKVGGVSTVSFCCHSAAWQGEGTISLRQLVACDWGGVSTTNFWRGEDPLT